MLSIFGILLSAQSIAIFHFLGEIPDTDVKSALSVLERYKRVLVQRGEQASGPGCLGGQRLICRPKWIMVFVWQCPIMFMSYSVCLFLLGLTLLVITPLIRIKERGWNKDVNVITSKIRAIGDANIVEQVALFFLVTALAASGTFVFCSYWIYHYVDLETDELMEPTEDLLQPVGSVDQDLRGLKLLPHGVGSATGVAYSAPARNCDERNVSVVLAPNVAQAGEHEVRGTAVSQTT